MFWLNKFVVFRVIGIDERFFLKKKKKKIWGAKADSRYKCTRVIKQQVLMGLTCNSILYKLYLVVI